VYGLGRRCPSDTKSAAQCRASAGVCDLAESCDGVGDDCPSDAKSTAQCRASAGVCDVVESCDGVDDDLSRRRQEHRALPRLGRLLRHRRNLRRYERRLSDRHGRAHHDRLPHLGRVL
jgi:hypothetical protein